MAELKKKIAEREALKNSVTAYSREHSPAISNGNGTNTMLLPPLTCTRPPHPPPGHENASMLAFTLAHHQQEHHQQQQQALPPPPPATVGNKRQRVTVEPVVYHHHQHLHGGGDPPSPLPHTLPPVFPYPFPSSGGAGFAPPPPPRPMYSAAIAAQPIPQPIPLPAAIAHPHHHHLPMHSTPMHLHTIPLTPTSLNPTTTATDTTPTTNNNRVALSQPEFEAALHHLQARKHHTLLHRDGLIHQLQESERVYEALCAEEYALVVGTSGLEGLLQQQQWQPPPPPFPPAAAAAAVGFQAPIAFAPTNTNKRKIDEVDIIDLAHDAVEEEEIPPPPPPPPPPPMEPPPPPPLQQPSKRIVSTILDEEASIPEYQPVSEIVLEDMAAGTTIKRASLGRSTRPFTSLLLSPAGISPSSLLSSFDISKSILGFSLDFGRYYLQPQGQCVDTFFACQSKKKGVDFLPLLLDDARFALLTASRDTKENDLVVANIALTTAQRVYHDTIQCIDLSLSRSMTEKDRREEARSTAVNVALKIVGTALEKKPNSQLLSSVYLQLYLREHRITPQQARVTIDVVTKDASGYLTWLGVAAAAPSDLSAAVVLHRGAVSLVQSDEKNARKLKLAGVVLDLTLRALRAVCSCTANSNNISMRSRSDDDGRSIVYLDVGSQVLPSISPWHAAWCSSPWSTLLHPNGTLTTDPTSALVLLPEHRELIVNAVSSHPTMLCVLWSTIAFTAAYHRLPRPVEHLLGEQKQAIALDWQHPIAPERIPFVVSALEQGLFALRITPAVYYNFIEQLENPHWEPSQCTISEFVNNEAKRCFVDTVRRFVFCTGNVLPLYFPGDLSTANFPSMRSGGGGSSGKPQNSPSKSKSTNLKTPAAAAAKTKSINRVDRVLVASSHEQAAEILKRTDHGWPRGGDVGFQLCRVIEIKPFTPPPPPPPETTTETKSGGGGGGTKRSSGGDTDANNDNANNSGKDELEQQNQQEEEPTPLTSLSSFWKDQAKVLVNHASTSPIFPKSPPLQWPAMDPQWMPPYSRNLPLALHCRTGNLPDYVSTGALVECIQRLPAEALFFVYEKVQDDDIMNGTPAAAEICVALLQRAIAITATAAGIEDDRGESGGKEKGNQSEKDHIEENSTTKQNSTTKKKRGGKRNNKNLSSPPTVAAQPPPPPPLSVVDALSTRGCPSNPTYPSINISLLEEASKRGCLTTSPLVSWAVPIAAGALISSAPPAAASLWNQAMHITSFISANGAWELLLAAFDVHCFDQRLAETATILSVKRAEAAQKRQQQQQQ